MIFVAIPNLRGSIKVKQQVFLKVCLQISLVESRVEAHEAFLNEVVAEVGGVGHGLAAVVVEVVGSLRGQAGLVHGQRAAQAVKMG